jgi:hypothetical protein
MATRVEELYEEDFYAWTRDQASALRRLADERWNGPLDLAHLAEEIEDVGSDRRDAVLSQMERVIEHLLKLEYSPSSRPRRKWLISIGDARYALERRMTLTLRKVAEDEIAKCYKHARRHAAFAMLDHGERDAVRELPKPCPYTLEQILDEDWLPTNRHGIADEDL